MSAQFVEIPASALVADKIGVVATKGGAVWVLLKDRHGKVVALATVSPATARQLSRDVTLAADLAEAETTVKS